MITQKASKKIDKTDPICGMQGTIPAHGHYFCSTNCIKKYEQQHNIQPEETCTSCAKPAKKWYTERLYVITILLIILLTISYML